MSRSQVRYFIDNVEALMKQSEGKNNCLIAQEQNKANIWDQGCELRHQGIKMLLFLLQAGPRVPSFGTASSAITPSEIAQCKLKQQQMATARKFLEAQRCGLNVLP